MAAYGVGSSGAALTFGGPSAFLDVAKAPAAQQQPSLRNQLLGNIIEQTRLIDTLFSELVASPRSSSGVNADTPHDPPQAGLIAIYTSLAHTSAEQAELVERARVHQARYEHLASRTRRRVDRVERAVTGAHHQQQQGGGRGSDARGGGAGVLVELADIAREAKELVRKGRKVRESIESAERGEFPKTAAARHSACLCDLWGKSGPQAMGALAANLSSRGPRAARESCSPRALQGLPSRPFE